MTPLHARNVFQML